MTSSRHRAFAAAFRLFAGVALLALATGAPATAVRTAHVEAELVAAKDAIVPGEPITVALRLKIEEGWHTYWRNPGDSGLPTTLTWVLPASVTAGPIEWPAPRALPVGPLVNYGYEGDALHLVELRPSGALRVGDALSLKARADWLVCRELCIPEGADLTLELPVAGNAGIDSRWGGAIAAARAALPQPLSGWQASAEANGATIALRLVPPDRGESPGEIRFFPYGSDQIEPSGPQRLEREDNAFVLTLPVASTLSGRLDRVAGVLTAAGGFGAARAATVDVPLAGAALAGPKPALAASPTLNLAPSTPAGLPGTLGLVVALVSALVGGLVLNLMPCVFPVLSLKVLGFATHHDTRPTLRNEAVAFAGGVVATFVALGLLLAALRAGGEQLGWGFQLQSPVVVAALAILFFVLALNLSGVFEFGQLAPSSVAGWTSKNRTADAFGSGVLAVVIASPCTAPFMGAALGFAMASPAATMLTVFVALGIGMALPYVLLAWFPGWRRRLPRPGPWLERFRQLLAFPLYATVIWLAWVLGAQRDNDAVVRLLIALLGIGFALWAWRIVRSGGARPWGIVAVLAFAGSALVAGPLFATESEAATKPVAAASADREWIAYTPAKLAELTASGRGVFVEFTAAWCVTCQVNKRLVLDTSEVRAAFARRNVALVRADWTRRDPAITRALAALGRSGVPAYVLYRPGKEPLLLPEVLQPGTVLDGLATL